MDAFRVTAPTRADLAGGTLDIWPIYCALGGGKTINVALDLKASATFEVMPAVVFKIGIEALDGYTCAFEEPLEPEQIKKLPAGVRFPAMVASEFLRQQPYLPEKFIRLKLETEAPMRSGLGGSSTLCVAMVRGLGKIFNQFVEEGWQWKLLNWVKDVEAAYLNTTTGTQDYLAALFGGLRCYQFDIGKIGASEYPDAVVKALDERLLVLFSGEMHSSGLANWDLYRGALEGNAEVMKGFRQIKEVAEHLHELLRAPQLNWKAIGESLNEEWKVRKNVFRVQTKRIDEIVDFLSAQNVIGRKVCGAAAGGSLIALVEPSRKTQVAEACTKAGIQVLKTAPATEGVTFSPAPGKLWQKITP